MNNNIVYDLEKLFLVIFLILFVTGLIIILLSYELGSRYGYLNPISFLVVGGVLSLVSGFGLVNVVMTMIKSYNESLKNQKDK